VFGEDFSVSYLMSEDWLMPSESSASVHMGAALVQAVRQMLPKTVRRINVLDEQGSVLGRIQRVYDSPSSLTSTYQNAVVLWSYDTDARLNAIRKQGGYYFDADRGRLYNVADRNLTRRQPALAHEEYARELADEFHQALLEGRFEPY
jgi:hypothetical protein